MLSWRRGVRIRDVASVEVAGAGYLNIKLDRAATVKADRAGSGMRILAGRGSG